MEEHEKLIAIIKAIRAIGGTLPKDETMELIQVLGKWAHEIMDKEALEAGGEDATK